MSTYSLTNGEFINREIIKEFNQNRKSSFMMRTDFIFDGKVNEEAGIKIDSVHYVFVPNIGTSGYDNKLKEIFRKRDEDITINYLVLKITTYTETMASYYLLINI